MNTQDNSLLKRIQTAVAASPDLQKQLTAATSADAAARLLSTALSQPVTATDLTALSDSVKADMTDEQLEAVAAGGTAGFLATCLGWLIGCGLVSAIAEIDRKGGCGKVLFEQNL